MKEKAPAHAGAFSALFGDVEADALLHAGCGILGRAVAGELFFGLFYVYVNHRFIINGHVFR